MTTFVRFTCSIFLCAALLQACGGDSAAPEIPPPTVLALSGDVGSAGDTLYLPFTVPAGVQRIDAAFDAGSPETKLGIGVFDARGTAFGSPGFRGISGEERREFFVAEDGATPGFVAGAIEPGAWTLVVPNFLTSGTAQVQLQLTYGPAAPTPARQPVPEAVIDQPGWYLGDLHVHTVHSSDAFGSGAGLDPAQMAQRAQGLGLHFISLTDHNVTTQSDQLRRDAPSGFLLLGGEEVTTWQSGPGHMTVSGLQSGDWIDWRFRPRSGRYAKTDEWGPDDRPVQSVLERTRELGVYTSVAHPMIWPGFGSDWGFFSDSDSDPQALPDGLEVWNGSESFVLTWGPAALAQWDRELGRQRHVCANGGSDVHGVGGATEVGTPTTAVYAASLSRQDIVAALKACRGYITTSPQGPALLLTAAGPGAQQQMVGGTLYGIAADTAVVSARVVGGEGGVLTLIQNGLPVSITTIAQNDQTVVQEITIGSGGAIRAELRASLLALEPLVLSNPIFLRLGSPPATADVAPDIAHAQATLPGAGASP